MPPDHLEGLSARAVWNADQVRIAQQLVGNFDVIREDFERLRAAAERGDRGVSWQPTVDFFLLAKGEWDEITLKAISWSDVACEEAPRVCSLLRGQPEVDGAASLSGRDL